MKLASLKHGRDGRLMVVSRDLARMLPAAPSLWTAPSGTWKASPAW